MNDAAVDVVGFGIAGVEEDLPESAAEGERAVVGLYLPPWEAFLARDEGDGRSPDDWMVDWLAWHRALVALYESAPARVHLVNAARLDSTDALAAHLAEYGLALPPGIQAPALPQTDVPVARVLAGAMAEFGRPLWEQYQAMEACAVLLGREPEFLGATGLPDLARSDELLEALREVQARAREAGDSAAARGAAGAATRARDDAALVTELRQENELLALQLQQLHEELHFQVESGRQLRQALAEAGAVATSARRLVSRLAERDVTRD